MISGFEKDCQARGLTKHTIETYRSSIKDFIGKYDPGQVGPAELQDHLGDLRRRGLQGSTLKGNFYAISSFFNYLQFEGMVSQNPVPNFRRRNLSRVRVRGETRQLISIQDMQFLIQSARNIRDIALISTFGKTGMRRGEVLDLKIDDIDLRRRIIRIPAKAKRSNRLAFIDDELAAILEQYLSWRQKKAKTSWLWISRAGGRIHKDYPGKVLASLGAELGLHNPSGPLTTKLTPHCLRHWFTTFLFRAGMNTEHIKFLRGDSLSSQAWQWYNHIDPETVRQEYLRCIPRVCMGPGKTEEVRM